jgi:hypothetical protein
VTVESDHPMTLGQLSVWRDLEQMRPDQHWEGNLSFTWPVPPGTPADQVWAVLGSLTSRHESLRTVYRGRAGGMRQWILPADGVTEAVRRGEADVAVAAGLEARELRRAFDITAEPPWRAWLLCGDGRPVRVLIVIHHIAADGVALNVLEQDFQVLLAGGRLDPAPQPRHLAAQENSGRRNAAGAPEDYWRKTLLAAGPSPAPPVPRGEVILATLHTGIPAAAAHRTAARLGTFLSGLLLAIYADALAVTFGQQRLLLYPMSSNRFGPGYASLVSSLNQWVAVLAEPDGRPFPQWAARLHWRVVKALKYGHYNVDQIDAIRAGLERDGRSPGPGWHFTFLPPPLDGQSAARWRAPSVEWRTPVRSAGPAFYLVADAYPAVTLTARAIRADFGRERFAAFLDLMQARISSLFSPHE